MSKIMYGEYDNYDYSSADEMTIDEQLSFMKKALNSAIEISKINKDTYWIDKIEYIKAKIKESEQLKKSWEGL